MWGQNWGQLVWGHAAAVPALGGLALLLFGAILLGLGMMLAKSKGARRGLVFFLVLLAPTLALAVPVSIVAFSNGTVADANQVNANFSALQNAVQTQQIDCTTANQSF